MEPSTLTGLWHNWLIGNWLSNLIFKLSTYMCIRGGKVLSNNALIIFVDITLAYFRHSINWVFWSKHKAIWAMTIGSNVKFWWFTITFLIVVFAEKTTLVFIFWFLWRKVATSASSRVVLVLTFAFLISL